MLDDLLKTHLLVVSADPALAAALNSTLTGGGYRVTTLDNPFLLASALRNSRPELILLDADQAGLPPGEAVRALRRSDSLRGTRVVFLSDGDKVQAQHAAQACGAEGALPRTCAPTDLLRLVKAVMHPPTVTTSALIRKTAAVIVEDAAVERPLLTSLASLAVQASSRGAAGLGAVITNNEAELLVLDPVAFQAWGGLGTLLARAYQAGNLTTIAVLVLGGSVRGDGNLAPADVADVSVVKQAVLATLRAARARRKRAT